MNNNHEIYNIKWVRIIYLGLAGYGIFLRAYRTYKIYRREKLLCEEEVGGRVYGGDDDDGDGELLRIKPIIECKFIKVDVKEISRWRNRVLIKCEN